MPLPCNPLNMPLWSLPGLSLYVACSERGHNSVMYPIKLLAEKHGKYHRLREMLPRFKCQQCGQAPAKALLCEKPYTDRAGMAGFDSGWKVDLLREARAGAEIIEGFNALADC
jgi:hypothetical protein